MRLGLSQDAAALLLGFSSPRLSQLENGKAALNTAEVIGVCVRYELAADESRMIEELAHDDGSVWWEEYASGVRTAFSQYYHYEEMCTELSVVEPSLLNGLLQTPDYVAAVHTADPLISEDDITNAIRFRGERQRRFWRRKPLPRTTIIMHEAAVSLPVVTGEAASSQRDELLRRAATREVDIRVLPASLGAHPAVVGFTILSFGIPEVPDMIYTENFAGPTYDSDQGLVGRCRRVLDATRALSVPIQEYLS